MLHDLFVCHSFFKSAFNFGEPQAETVWMGTPTIYLRRPNRPTSDPVAKAK